MSAPVEDAIRALCERGEQDAALTLALETYGREIFGFLVAIHRDDGAASDAFSLFSENLWRGLPKFSWECSVRAWAYTIARHASHRHLRNGKKHARGRVGVSDAIERLEAKVRTETLTYLKTEKKDRFAAIRATLEPEDQMILLLRLDRRLAWDEIARVMSSEEGSSGANLKTEAARLRKRFQLLKDRLVELGKKAGLIKND